MYGYALGLAAGATLAAGACEKGDVAHPERPAATAKTKTILNI
jgi:hypothetical protein